VPAVLVQPVPAKKAVASESTDKFLKKLFANGAHLEECFHRICNAGCPTEEFGQLLWATCMLMSFQSVPLFNGGNLTKAQLKGLPKRMRALAEIIEALNATPLTPGNEVKFMPDAPKGTSAQAARKYLVQRYEMLPRMLNFYSYHLERFTRIVRKSLKRLTTAHVSAIRVLRYVEDCTGSPRYGELAELLEQGCLISLIAGKEESVPRFLTAEGLAKLYHRWGNVVCGPNIRKIKD
jgi:hypothetical protein